MSVIQDLSSLVEETGIHSRYDGYTGNCANIAVALYEIALEEFDDDRFRFVMVDRPSHFGSGPDHIALEYNGQYLDSKGIHTRQELLDNITNSKQNEAALLIESKSYVVSVHYYDETIKDEIKSVIRNQI